MTAALFPASLCPVYRGSFRSFPRQGPSEPVPCETFPCPPCRLGRTRSCSKEQDQVRYRSLADFSSLKPLFRGNDVGTKTQAKVYRGKSRFIYRNRVGYTKELGITR